ncbi:hypothetical protein KDA_50880 [Dictyobacter alpinus]|uniref:Uncharacterized protein n=1 Tax=Dictyobacter alpinus TaxID=2014873 RepID=A0A402BE02_9CHLR|nr:hypothetical protein [Dictyobacter alpinus]GCE29604.1 hypothetical protein KDA_50880 [Dictyobacter alpinus]
MKPLINLSRPEHNRHLAGCLPSFDVITAHEQVLLLPAHEALHSSETLANPDTVRIR